MRKNINGFTIVELLIVIVIIAILATVSVVAMRGVQNRAKAAQYSSAVNQYIKLLDMYKNDHGSYPSSDAAEFPSSGESCLGEASDYPADGAMPAGYCLYDVGYPSWRISSSAALTGQLKTYGSLPKPPLDIVASGDERWRGIRYRDAIHVGRQFIEISWLMKGANASYCGIAGAAAYPWSPDDTTYCSVTKWAN